MLTFRHASETGGFFTVITADRLGTDKRTQRYKRFKSRNPSIDILIQFSKHIYAGESVFLFILDLPDLLWTNLVTMVQRPSTLMIQIKGGTIRQKAALWQAEIGRIRTAGREVNEVK